MDGEKAHLGEARGHVCTLLCKTRALDIREHSLEEVSGVTVEDLNGSSAGELVLPTMASS